jgi:hypothetical protein
MKKQLKKAKAAVRYSTQSSEPPEVQDRNAAAWRAKKAAAPISNENEGPATQYRGEIEIPMNNISTEDMRQLLAFCDRFKLQCRVTDSARSWVDEEGCDLVGQGQGGILVSISDPRSDETNLPF